tara:strand:- start:9177 stop:9338 length:162 start_codon:yes stop_codon:yes gene_type:complete
MKTKIETVLNDFINKVDINLAYKLIELKKILYFSYDKNNVTTKKLVHEKPLLN